MRLSPPLRPPPLPILCLSSAAPARSASSRAMRSREISEMRSPRRGAAARATLVRVWSWGLSRVSKPRGQGSRWGQEQIRSRVLHNGVRVQVRVRVLVRVRVRIGVYRVRVRVPRLQPPPWLPAASLPRPPAPAPRYGGVIVFESGFCLGLGLRLRARVGLRVTVTVRVRVRVLHRDRRACTTASAAARADFWLG